MSLGCKTHGGLDIKAPGAEVSSGVLYQPSQISPRDGKKAPLGKESGNVTPLFPSPIPSTSFHSVICLLNSHRRLWEMGIFGDAVFSPCPLAASGQDPCFWRIHPLPACRALTATGKHFAFFQDAPINMGCVV